MDSQRIVLVRHGRPEWTTGVWIRGSELAGHIRGRDLAPIDPTLPPADELEELARTSDVVVASTLRRSYESAELLAPDAPITVDALYREVFTPTAFTSAVRLPAKLWGGIARLRWLAGWSPGVESYVEAKLRAQQAASTLEMLSTQHGSVLLAAHGIMNGLIAQWLRKNRWKGPSLRGRRFWSFMVYEKGR